MNSVGFLRGDVRPRAGHAEHTVCGRRGGGGSSIGKDVGGCLAHLAAAALDNTSAAASSRRASKNAKR